MAVPSSIKETYENFLNRYRAHVEGNTFTHWRTIYYDACQNPLDTDLIVFVWHGAAKESDLMYQMVKYWSQHQKAGYDKVRVIIAKKEQLKNLPEISNDCAVPASDANRPMISRLYAQASCIVTAGWLPAFFVKREGQRVINLYEPINVEGDKVRLKNADRRLSSYLNSSVICVRDQAQYEEVCRREQLEGLYQGGILCFDIADGEESFFASLMQCIFENEESGMRLFETHHSKKHMLLYYNWGEEPAYFELMRLFTQLIDYEKWDVTCLCKDPSSDREKFQLLSLAPQVRILYEVNNFNCGTEEYLEQQYILQNLLYFEDIKEAVQCLDAAVLRSEFQGVLGQSDFDEFLQFEDFSIQGICLALSMPMKQIKKVELKDFIQEKNYCETSELTVAFDNQLKLYGQVYQKMVFPTENLKQAAFAAGDYESSQLQVYTFPSMLSDMEDSCAYQKITFRDQTYAVCGIRDQFYQNLLLKIVPCLRENEKGYLIDARQTDLVVLFHMIEQQKDFYADKWVVAGIETNDLNRMTSLKAPTGQVVVLNTFYLEEWPDLCAYLQQYEGYLTINKEDSSPLRIAMELSGKDILLCSEDGIDKIQDPCFQDFDSYNQSVKKYSDAFINDNL